MDLKGHIARHALQISPVQLSSGMNSSEYFNMKNLGVDGLLEASKRLYRNGAASVGGPATGAIPLAVAMSVTHPLEWFYVRKGGGVEGRLKGPALVLDDVITTGGSVLKAIQAIRDLDVPILGISCIIFRGGRDHRERLEEEGDFRFLYAQGDFEV